MITTFYRKYRPQTFDQVVGQEMITRILKNAAITGKISQAYLFSGPRGTGKTSTARIVAKVVNCLTREKDKEFAKLGEPCNKCANCKEINSGKCLDLIEIDAGSNRGIDEIRNLKENIKAVPTVLKKKVFIIDEVHQLTNEAFNALLKVLEEPPEHAMFILATTEFSKVPLTIISRTQQFHFKRIPLSEIQKKIEYIAKQEKIDIEPQAIEFISTSAEGSIRDAECLLDQLSSLSDRRITVKDVEQMIGKIILTELVKFSKLLLTGDKKTALLKLEEIKEGGYDLVRFCKDLIIYLRKVAALKYQPELKKIFSEQVPGKILAEMIEQAKMIEPKHLKLLKSLINAYSQMRYSQFPIIPLEIAIMEGW